MQVTLGEIVCLHIRKVLFYLCIRAYLCGPQHHKMHGQLSHL